MADEDIYGNKRRYERSVATFDRLVEPPDPSARRGRRRYFCRNPSNLKYFFQLHHRFQARDTSFVRRNRILHVLLFLTSVTNLRLSECQREDVDEMVARGHEVNLTVASKTDFIKSVRWLWKTLLPEKDSDGRVLDDAVPYPVRHLSGRVDKSRQRRRNEKLTFADYERIVGFFSGNAKMQAFVTLAVESLGRPQEICYTRIKDLETHEGYARIWVSSHGKEGVKFLDCVESFPYVMKWFAQHPHQKDGEALLFCSRDDRLRPMRPAGINKQLRRACEKLGIDKRITCYSLKRNGVTFCRLRGESDVDIQHKAGWTSTKQLKTYDLSTPGDTFRLRLARQGLVDSRERDQIKGRRVCADCGAMLGFADQICTRCGHVPPDPGERDGCLKAEGKIRHVLATALR